MSAEPDLLFEGRGAAGLITLNRPHALNAVTGAMVRSLARKLEEWETDPAVTRIIVTANGERAFSAGGDLRALYDLGRAGQHEEQLAFFRGEYRLNARIKRFAKPYICLIDGMVMGGGVGISVHGSHRIAGDKYLFAMPEVGIGFFPDVGGTWFLPRLPGQLGTWCALTGERLKSADAVTAGVATHRVASARFPELAQVLCGNTDVDAAIGAFAEPPGRGPVLAYQPLIDRCFAHDTVEEILAALDAAAAGEGAHAAFASTASASIRAKCPTSLKIALAQMRAGIGKDFEECMRTEFRVVTRVLRGTEFYEGVRAVIIDKDQSPRWRPPSLAEVTPEQVMRYFDPLPSELPLP
jgi:enoyl-CoA hydratase/carnithine racemase